MERAVTRGDMYCDDCYSIRPTTYLAKERCHLPTMSMVQWGTVVEKIRVIASFGGRRFELRVPEVTWEMFAGVSGDCVGLRHAGLPLPSVAVECDHSCHSLLEEHCQSLGPTHAVLAREQAGRGIRIFDYVQAGHARSVPSARDFATNWLHFPNEEASTYFLDILVACGVCTPYTSIASACLGPRRGSYNATTHHTH